MIRRLQKILNGLTLKQTVYLMTIVGTLVYFYSFFGNFVWDDKTYISLNSQLHTFDLGQYFGFNLFNSIGQYRPLAVTYFGFLYLFFTDHAFFYHIFQLALHITNAVLLFILFKKFFNKTLSLFISLLFLVHPINVESVGYIAASENPLFFAFGMGALLLTLEEKINTKKFVLLFSLLLLSLHTKEAGLLFVFVILAYIFAIKRVQQGIYLAGSVGVTLMYFLVRFFVGNVYFAKLGIVPIAKLTFLERLLNVPAVMYYYLKTFIFPWQLAIDQQWIVKSLNISNFYIPLLVDVLFIVLAVWGGVFLFKQHKKNFLPYIFFATWFVLGMGLYSQIFPLDATVAERWFYFPMVGLLGMVATILQTIKLSTKNMQHVAWSLGIIILLLLSLRTVVRLNDWLTPVGLYTHDMQINDNYDLENSLGFEYSNTGHYPEALQYFQKSVSVVPFETNLYNLAYTYQQLGNIPMAKYYYGKSLHGYSEKSAYATPHQHTETVYIQYTNLLVYADKPEVAITFIKSALQDYPNSSHLWIELAVSEYKNHDQKAALQAAEKAVQLAPTDQNNYIYAQIQNKQPIPLMLSTKSPVLLIKP